MILVDAAVCSQRLGGKIVGRRVLGAALIFVLLAGCSPGSLAPSGAPTGTTPGSTPGSTPGDPSYEHYVALGDSFTAGPFIPTTDLAGGCFRSDGNYSSILARRLHIADVVDVSCSGASTRDLRRPQHTFRDAKLPPQLQAVRADTDLVTLGIGGNDFNLFGTLVQTCTMLRAVDPTGSPCADNLASRGTDLVAQTRRIGTRVARAVRAVQRRAPDATILLVGYLRLAPTFGSCPRLLPLATGDLTEADLVTHALNRELARAARRTHVEFIDMYAASKGHDVCSAHPWANGQTADRQAAFAYHPFAAGMRAVADRIVARLR